MTGLMNILQQFQEKLLARNARQSKANLGEAFETDLAETDPFLSETHWKSSKKTSSSWIVIITLNVG